jgi:fructan beta-fructosidase
MKPIFLVLFFLLSSTLLFAQKNQKELKFNEEYRPQNHFSPEQNRMGSPISIMAYDSAYHLFYQLNPHNLSNGYYNWGYALSPDLLRWEHRGISIAQPHNVTDSLTGFPWWGTALVKQDKPLAWTGIWDGEIKHFSSFRNGVWENSAITTGTEHISRSEPFVFFHDSSQKWVMVANNRADSTVYILNSPDGLGWNETSKFSYRGGFISLTELPVENLPGEKRWLFLTENGNYMLGNFNGEKFEIITALAKIDQGNLVGGAICFNDIEGVRTLFVSELKSEQHPDIPSNGQLSFPTALKLYDTETGLQLIRQPVTEIAKLHVKTTSWQNKKVYPGIDKNLLSPIKGKAFHFKGLIDMKNSDHFGFIIRCDRENKGTELHFNVARKEVSLLGNTIKFSGENNKVEFEIIVDRSSIEFFVDGGKHVISSTFAPEPKDLRYVLYTIGGEIFVESMDVHALKSIWNEKE